VTKRTDGKDAPAPSMAEAPTLFRVQYLDPYSTILAEQHTYSNSVAGALALVEAVMVPGAVRIRILNAEGHLLYSKLTAPREDRTPLRARKPRPGA
jgi:hypothetical protein